MVYNNPWSLFYQLLLSVPVVSHTVNLLSALPLQCLDVLLMVPPEPGSEQRHGVNMDCVHTLVLFMERRLETVRGREEAVCLAAQAKLKSFLLKTETDC